MCVSRWLSVSSLVLQLRASRRRRRFLTLLGGCADDVASTSPVAATGAGPAATMPASQNAAALSAKRKLAALKVS
uniref:Uncharacterized protein n=1 Tax=Arundo donax TaxID=35708 RepID=A0A0A9FIY7_ARUDO